MMQPANEWPTLLNSAEVASLFRVSINTVSNWAVSGRLKSTRTPGGRHRFDSRYIRELLAEDQ